MHSRPLAPPRRLVILGMNLTALAVGRRAHRSGMEPYVVDVTRGPALESRLIKHLLIEGRPRSHLLPEIVELARGRDAWLISTADAWRREMMQHRDTLDAVFSKVLQPSNDALAVCLSKTRFAQWCEANDIPAPRRYRVRSDTFEVEDGISFPVLVRPSVTQHSAPHPDIAKAVEVSTSQDLKARLKAFQDAGLEPAISESLLGRRITQISVGFAMTRDRSMTLVARKVRPAPDACRLGTLVETIVDPAAEALAVQAAGRLHYEGIGEVEILKDRDSGRMYVIEINARPWMQFGLAEAAGRDLFGFLLQEGELAAPLMAQRSKVWIDFSGDLWNCFNPDDGLVPRGRLTPRRYLKSVLRATTYARWSWQDPRPFLTDTMALARSGLRLLRRGRQGKYRGTGDRPRRRQEKAGS